MIPKPLSLCQGCPIYEGPWGKKDGFVPGDSHEGWKVLLVAEAAGEDEELSGHPLVGKSGQYLWGLLKRVGIYREDFYIANVLACRPPDNKLAGEFYEQQAIRHCGSHLDNIIRHCGNQRAALGKPLVILTLGKIAFKRILDLDEKRDAALLKADYLNYPFWSDKYGAYVVACDHPAYLVRGSHHLASVLQFGATRAIRMATEGFAFDKPNYILDPDPSIFEGWISDYRKALEADPEDTYLSYDIETPMKNGNDEEDVAREDDDDYTILRCSFSYRRGHAVSVPWRTEYMAALQRLFFTNGNQLVGWNSIKYDDPRVKAQIPFYGQSIDAMYAWHVLNSALPKGLGFVSPFYNPGASMWKHLSDAEPAFYNAKDADMALGNWLGIKEDLKKNGQWEIFKSHQIEMGKVFSYMSSKGVLRDNVLRDEAEKKLQEIINGLNSSINEVVPFAAKKLKTYKKTPKSTDGLVQVPGIRDTKQCPACGAIDVKAEHFKSIGKKRLKAGETENPCLGFKAQKHSLSSQVWAEVQDFKLSKDALTRYQNVVGHFPVVDRRKKTTTFDEKAILRLRRKYPKDQLYPLIGEFREHQKLLGTYIGITQPGGWIKGGLPVDQYGLIHTQFTDNPSTLRSASQNPNLQNLPRPSKDPNAPGNIIRRLIIAHPGCTFLARDYSGIEAVLVGYFARSPGYIRLAKQDVHSFYTAYALHELDGRIAANDLPLLSWDDEKLFSRLAEIKKEFNEERNALYKHLVHGANFMQGPAGAAEKILAETGKEFPIPLVKRVMDIYFELFPDIRKWHKRELLEADETGYSRNPFGYVHRFNKVFQWEKVGGQWQREQGPDANRVIAFKPQSTAAGIIKEAMMRMFFNRFEEAGQYLRLLIHDEVFTECPEEYADTLDTIMQEEMERPIQALPLLPTWNMGTHLVINTEAKKGPVWGLMK